MNRPTRHITLIIFTALLSTNSHATPCTNATHRAAAIRQAIVSLDSATSGNCGRRSRINYRFVAAHNRFVPLRDYLTTVRSANTYYGGEAARDTAEYERVGAVQVHSARLSGSALDAFCQDVEGAVSQYESIASVTAIDRSLPLYQELGVDGCE